MCTGRQTASASGNSGLQWASCGELTGSPWRVSFSRSKVSWSSKCWAREWVRVWEKETLWRGTSHLRAELPPPPLLFASTDWYLCLISDASALMLTTAAALPTRILLVMTSRHHVLLLLLPAKDRQFLAFEGISPVLYSNHFAHTHNILFLIFSHLFFNTDLVHRNSATVALWCHQLVFSTSILSCSSLHFGN